MARCRSRGPDADPPTKPQSATRLTASAGGTKPRLEQGIQTTEVRRWLDGDANESREQGESSMDAAEAKKSRYAEVRRSKQEQPSADIKPQVSPCSPRACGVGPDAAAHASREVRWSPRLRVGPQLLSSRRADIGVDMGTHREDLHVGYGRLVPAQLTERPRPEAAGPPQRRVGEISGQARVALDVGHKREPARRRRGVCAANDAAVLA